MTRIEEFPMGNNTHGHDDGPVDWDGKVIAWFLVGLTVLLVITWAII